MDLTLPRLSLPRFLLPLLHWRPRRAGPEPDGPAPASLHGDLGLAPAAGVPPHAGALRHVVEARIGLL